MLAPEDLSALLLTLQLAGLTTLLLLPLATVLAWWLAHSQARWRAVVQATVALPLVLPPTVLGFYVLVLLGPHGWIGQWTQAMGWGVWSFSFTGLLLGSMVFSLPFAVQPIQYAFEAVGKRPLEVAATLRASRLDAFFTVAVPMARPGFFTAIVLCFAHTVGEFGVALMVGGNIPDKTRVVSTQIVGHVEALEFSQAHALSGVLVVLSFTVLLALSLMHRRNPRMAM